VVSSRDRIQLFVAVKGHRFPRDAFEAMLAADGTIEPTMVDQPAAAALMNPDGMRPYDAVLLYDMPGLDFEVSPAARPAFVPPDPVFRTGFEALLRSGKGIVALHHALAGWPAWPAYAEALGGAFLYRSWELRGVPRADSGYLAGARYQVRTAATGHPVLQGVPERFDLVDELYRAEIFDDGSLEPLLYRELSASAERYESAARAIGGAQVAEREATSPANPLLGWAKAAGASPLVYLQPGDGPSAYENPHYRTLVHNAVKWVASGDARTWARSRASAAGTA
jgi:type 1 glutamine amidotransferase